MQRCFSYSKLAAAPVVGWSLPGQLLQSSRELLTKVTVLAIDLDRGFGSLMHVLLALGCVGVLRIAELNKEFAEVTQAAFPQSVHLECVHKLDPETFEEVLSRRSLVRGGSSCRSDTVRSTDVTDLAFLLNQVDTLVKFVSGFKSRWKNGCGRNRVSPDRDRNTCFIDVELSPSGGQCGRLRFGVQTVVDECRCVLAATPFDRFFCKVLC